MSIKSFNIMTVLSEAFRQVESAPGDGDGSDIGDEIPMEYAEEIIIAGAEVAVRTAAGWVFGAVWLTWPEAGKAEVDYYAPDYPRHWLRETFTVEEIMLWSTFEAEGIASL